MVNLTLWTVPLTYTQRHFIYYMPTVSTPFRGWKPSVNFNQFSFIPLAFVGKLADKFTPGSVTNVKRQFMVRYHIFDCQILNHDGLVFVHQLSRQLMQKVFSAIRNCAVYFGYLLPLFMSIIRAFLLTGQRFLYSFKLGSQPLKVFRIGDFIPIACSYQASDTHVQTDTFISFSQWFNNRVYKQRNVKTPRSIQLDRYRTGFASSWQLSTPTNRQCLSTLCKNYLSIPPLESGFSKLSTTTVMLFLKVWVLSCSRPQVSKSAKSSGGSFPRSALLFASA